MGKRLAMVVLFFVGCTTVKVEVEDVPPQKMEAKNLSIVRAEALGTIGTQVSKPIQPGDVLVVLRVEQPREQEGTVEEEPSGLKPTDMVRDAWPNVLQKLNEVNLFRGRNIEAVWDPQASLIQVETYVKRAQDNKKAYVFMVSCREHLSVPTSVFHQALKATTLNLYDFIPFFKYNLGSFHVNYTALWEGALIQVSTGKVALHVSGLATVKAFDRGEDLLFDGDDDYKKTAFARAGQLFVQRITKLLEAEPSPKKI